MLVGRQGNDGLVPFYSYIGPYMAQPLPTTVDLGPMAIRVFANGPGDLGSIRSRVILKTLKMVLDTFLLNTQQYKIHIKDKVELSRERNSALPYTSM